MSAKPNKGDVVFTSWGQKAEYVVESSGAHLFKQDGNNGWKSSRLAELIESADVLKAPVPDEAREAVKRVRAENAAARVALAKQDLEKAEAALASV